MLEVLEVQIRDVASAVAAECFLYRVELDLHALHLVPGDEVSRDGEGHPLARGDRRFERVETAGDPR